MFIKTLALAAAVGSAVADRPANMSICDYYTTALLMNNTADNQMTLLTLVVNTAVIGNYTTPNVGVVVPGILAPGMVNGTGVNLLPYFDGGLDSTNDGGSAGISVNFLDGGGAAPLMKNMPADDESSNQYILLTHLYEYFGVLLGCSMQGTGDDDYPAYDGDESMYETHKFMDLSYAEVTYFIDQVALSAMSFGVAASDLSAVGAALMNTFGYRCEPPMTVIEAQGAQLQSICTDDTCPLAPNSACASYNATMTPVIANSTLVPNTTASAGSGTPSTGTSSGSSSKTSTTSSSTATGSSISSSGAVTVGFSFAAVAAGLAAFFL